MTEAAMDRRSSTATPNKLLGLVTNASVDPKIPRINRWGFIRTPDGKEWFFVYKNVSGKWPREGEYVSFEPLILNTPGKTDKAIDVFVVNRQ